MTDQIRFRDGAGYERYMGQWSQLAGDVFLDWLAPAKGLRWLDVGCGSGAFTEMIVERCAPTSVDGLDPSEAQLAFARERPTTPIVTWHQGDAMTLPFPDASLDLAVMPLVIFFVPDPAQGVREMARVVRPGGIVTAYAWDMTGGADPYASLRTAMNEMGVTTPAPPSPAASRVDTMREMWSAAGVGSLETTAITVARAFADFDDYWTTATFSPSVGAKLAAMPPADYAALQAGMRERLPADASGRIVYSARANAIKGRVRA